MLCRTHFETPSFTKTTLEDGNVLTFAWDIWLGQLPATVIILPEWITPSEVEVPRKTEMEAALACLAPEHPRLAGDTSRPERVSVPLLSVSPLSLAQPLMVAPFLSPLNVWHKMHAKIEAMGITQRVILFVEWLRAVTVKPQKGINALTSVDL